MRMHTLSSIVRLLGDPSFNDLAAREDSVAARVSTAQDM